MLQEAQNDLKSLQVGKKAQKAKAKAQASKKQKEDEKQQDKNFESQEEDSEQAVEKEKARRLKSRRSSKRNKDAPKPQASKKNPKTRAAPKKKAAGKSTPTTDAIASDVGDEPVPSDEGAKAQPKKRKYDVVVPKFRTCEIVPYGSRNEAGLKLKKQFVLEDKKAQAICCEFLL
jgi:hypothetical protein